MTVYDVTILAAFEPPNHAELAIKMPQKHSSHEKCVSECFFPLNTDVAVALLGSYHTHLCSAFKRACDLWFTTSDIESIVSDGAKDACNGQQSVDARDFQ